MEDAEDVAEEVSDEEEEAEEEGEAVEGRGGRRGAKVSSGDEVQECELTARPKRRRA